MTKNKIKLSLIEDYIKIVLIKNFYSNSFDDIDLSAESRKLLDNCKKLNQLLLSTYELLLDKLNLNDISLDILKQELKQNNLMFLREKTDNFSWQDLIQDKHTL